MNHHKLRRLRVFGGFLDKLDLQFADGLNCLIGGRGSGKTTALEFIRFALDRIPKTPGAGGKIADDRLRALLAANLGSTGCVEVEFESREGMVYTIRRSQTETTITDANGQTVDPQVLGSPILIDAAIFSHNEIETIASDPRAQRELLDRLCAQPLHSLQGEIDAAAAALRENSQRLLQVAARRRSASQDLVDLASWESKLAAANASMAETGLPLQLQEAATAKERRATERAALDAAAKALGGLRDRLGEAATARVRELAGVIPEAAATSTALGELRDELRRRATELEILLSPVVDRLATLTAATDRARNEVLAAHAPEEAAYDTLVAAADNHSEHLSARDAAAQQVLRLQSVKREIVELEETLRSATAERLRLRETYGELRRRRTATRERSAAAISDRLGGRVRIIVEADGESTDYRELLVALMKKSGRQYNAPIDRVLAAIAPGELGELADRQDHSALAARADVNTDFAETLIAQLRDHPERRFELDVLDREDAPKIELRIGERWRSADRLSTGQKSSAILPILLLESEAPLLIDQPEDNLDNSFISDAIIPQIRETKTRRQLLAITHNPNIPVLGDAERVIVMEADGQASRALAQGDLSATKEHILRLMEGGREAFRRRQERYAGGSS